MDQDYISTYESDNILNSDISDVEWIKEFLVKLLLSAQNPYLIYYILNNIILIDEDSFLLDLNDLKIFDQINFCLIQAKDPNAKEILLEVLKQFLQHISLKCPFYLIL